MDHQESVRQEDEIQSDSEETHTPESSDEEMEDVSDDERHPFQFPNLLYVDELEEQEFSGWLFVFYGELPAESPTSDNKTSVEHTAEGDNTPMSSVPQEECSETKLKEEQGKNEIPIEDNGAEASCDEDYGKQSAIMAVGSVMEDTTQGNFRRELRRSVNPEVEYTYPKDEEKQGKRSVDLKKPSRCNCRTENFKDEFGLALKKLREELNSSTNTKGAVLPCFQIPTPGVSRYVEELEKLEMAAYGQANSIELASHRNNTGGTMLLGSPTQRPFDSLGEEETATGVQFEFMGAPLLTPPPSLLFSLLSLGSSSPVMDSDYDQLGSSGSEPSSINLPYSSHQSASLGHQHFLDDHFEDQVVPNSCTSKVEYARSSDDQVVPEMHLKISYETARDDVDDGHEEIENSGEVPEMIQRNSDESDEIIHDDEETSF